MAKKQEPLLHHPVCPEHWQKLRQEALQGLPFWSRPFAGSTIEHMLRDRGFFESSSECSFCQTNTNVDNVK